MNANRMKHWVLSAALIVGGASSPAFAAPPQQTRDREVEVRMADLPRSLREAIDDERGRRDIKHIEHVFRNGNEWYRITIDERANKEKVIRMTENGKVLSEDQFRDDGRDYEREIPLAAVPREVRETIHQERGRHDLKGVFKVHRDGHTFYRAIIDERKGDRIIRVGEEGRVLEDRDVREVRRGVDDDGDQIPFDRLPGVVRTTIAREAGQDTIGDVYRYHRRGFTLYETDLRSQSRVRQIRVTDTGRVVSETDETPEGRRLVRFDDLPGAVRSGLAGDVNPRDITRIVQVTYKGTTVYRARVERSGRDAYWITVDDSGRTTREWDAR